MAPADNDNGRTLLDFQWGHLYKPRFNFSWMQEGFFLGCVWLIGGARI